MLICSISDFLKKKYSYNEYTKKYLLTIDD